ncbi:MAG: CPBP family intramembrane glutamic endopeptidase [Chitinophagales bacterium]
MQQTYTTLQKRRTVVLFSSILITVVYWIVALWYTNKTAYSKDLVVFHQLFGPGDKWQDLWQYVYQFAVTVLLFWIVPYLITKYYLKEDFSKLGLGLTYNKQALIICAMAYPIVIASTYFSSQDPLIAAEYPLSKLIGSTWSVFVAYQSVYLFYFVAYEIFYRGYLQFGLKSEQAGTGELFLIILFQTVLTTLFHIGKPAPEIISAAAFGPVFGYVAFRYNSIWYGMVIHFGMNVFLDLFSLHWLHLLPQKLF